MTDMTDTGTTEPALSPEEEAHFWLVQATLATSLGNRPVPPLPAVVLEAIIKLMSPPGYLTLGDITANPVVKAAYASINHALYEWPQDTETTRG